MKNIKKIAILFSGLAFLVGCQDPSYPSPVASTAVNSAHVALINAAPDYPTSPASFLINNAATSITFPGTSIVSVTASAEQFRIKNGIFGVVSPGDTVAQKADLVFYSSASSATITGGTSPTNLNTLIQGGRYYTYILTDTINNPYGKGKNSKGVSNFIANPGGVTFTEIADVIPTLTTGNAGIRFFNLAPGAPTVYLTHDGGQTFSGLTSFAYKKTTGTFTTVPTGTYSIEVRTGSAAGTIIFTLPNVSFADNKSYTVFLTGKVVKGIAVPKVSYAVSTVQHN